MSGDKINATEELNEKDDKDDEDLTARAIAEIFAAANAAAAAPTPNPQQKCQNEKGISTKIRQNISFLDRTIEANLNYNKREDAKTQKECRLKLIEIDKKIKTQIQCKSSTNSMENEDEQLNCKKRLKQHHGIKENDVINDEDNDTIINLTSSASSTSSNDALEFPQRNQLKRKTTTARLTVRTTTTTRLIVRTTTTTATNTTDENGHCDDENKIRHKWSKKHYKETTKCVFKRKKHHKRKSSKKRRYSFLSDSSIENEKIKSSSHRKKQKRKKSSKKRYNKIFSDDDDNTEDDDVFMSDHYQQKYQKHQRNKQEEQEQNQNENTTKTSMEKNLTSTYSFNYTNATELHTVQTLPMMPLLPTTTTETENVAQKSEQKIDTISISSTDDFINNDAIDDTSDESIEL